MAVCRSRGNVARALFLLLCTGSEAALQAMIPAALRAAEVMPSALRAAEAMPSALGSFPEAQIECPNAGCGVTVSRTKIGEHRGGCGWEKVGCPCPGCEERMARVDVEQHVVAREAEHLRQAWEKEKAMEERVMKMEEKVAKQGGVIMKQKEKIAGMQRRADALTRVFTWSTGSEWDATGDSYTFTGGVVGQCFNLLHDSGEPDEPNAHLIGFELEEGPACTMHFKCSILDKNDKVLRVVSDPTDCDFQKPPIKTEELGAWFDLTEADKAGAVRADGSIKLRMVVHLYLPE